jgi:branched-chain amino acid transport system substrate-binding protein
MMKLKSMLGAAAAVVALSLSAGASAQTVPVSTVGPITGQYAAFGEQMKRGLEKAVKDLNAKGGVMGKQLTAVVEDDACDPKQARAAAEKVAAAKVVAVFGHFCSSSSIPASEVYNDAKIIQITPASTNPKLTDDAAAKGWNNVFRTCGRDDAQGGVAGKYLAAKFKGQKVAILHDKSTYGKGLADETKKAMEKAGMKPAMYESYSQGDKDFNALVTKMKAAKIAAVYVGGYHTEAALLIRQAHEQGFKPQLLSGDAMVTDEFWNIAGPAGEGAMMTFQPDPRKLPTAAAVVKDFDAEGYNPEGYTLYTYAAVQVWKEAVEKAKSMDTAAVSKVIRGGTFSTVIGSLSYDKKGDVANAQYVWFVWKNGKYEEVK